jgi:hypothetical protein
MLTFYKNPDDVDAVQRVYREQDVLLQPLEAYALLVTARAQASLEGDMREADLHGKGCATLLGL